MHWAVSGHETPCNPSTAANLAVISTLVHRGSASAERNCRHMDRRLPQRSILTSRPDLFWVYSCCKLYISRITTVDFSRSTRCAQHSKSSFPLTVLFRHSQRIWMSFQMHGHPPIFSQPTRHRFCKSARKDITTSLTVTILPYMQNFQES